MHENIVETATAILVSVFSEAGWQCDDEKEHLLERAVNDFFTKSMSVTDDGESHCQYAIISKRGLLETMGGERDTSTNLGVILRQLERQFYMSFHNLGMEDFLDKVPPFSIVLTGEVKMEIVQLGYYGMISLHYTPTQYKRVERRRLLYSSDYGENLRTMVLVENDEVKMVVE